MRPMYLEVVHDRAGRGRNPPFHIESYWRDLAASLDFVFRYRPEDALPGEKRDYTVRVALNGSWDLLELLREALWRSVLEPCAAPGGAVTAVALDRPLEGLAPDGFDLYPRYDVWADWVDFMERVSLCR